MRVLQALAFLCVFAALPAATQAAPETESVGIYQRITDLVIQGPEVEAKPLDECPIPVVVRITAVRPHGTDFRYDFTFYGLEAGTYDLRLALRRKNSGAELAKSAPISVTVQSKLKPGVIKPGDPKPLSVPVWGHYQLLLVFGGLLWFAGLLLLVFYRSDRSKPELQNTQELTLSDRVEPYLQKALSQTLEPSEQAELERLVYSYWRKNLGLEKYQGAELVQRLRQHAKTGPLLKRLEQWLHAPGNAQEMSPDAIKPFLAEMISSVQSSQTTADSASSTSDKSEQAI